MSRLNPKRTKSKQNPDIRDSLSLDENAELQQSEALDFIILCVSIKLSQELI